MSISAIVHTYNSEKYLAECLNALQEADEIIVCDMYSTDATVEIAKKYGAKVIFFENCGIPEPARSYAIEQASCDWILVVDSDEIVPLALMNFLKEKISHPDWASAIVLPRRNLIFGHFLRATYPDYHVRFFLKSRFLSWPPLVHRGAIVEGKHYTIEKSQHALALIHYNHDSIASFLEKMNRYSSLEMDKWRHKKIRFWLWAALTRPMVEFIKLYVLKGGFLDGYAGFIYAQMMAFYKFVILAKLWQERYEVKRLETQAIMTK